MQALSSIAARFGLLAVIGLTSLSVRSAEAQSLGTADTARQHALARLRPGTEIRVSEDQRVFEGPLSRLTSNEVVLAEGAAEHSLTLNGIDSLWVARRATGKGALIGAIVGLGVGALVGAGVAPDGSDTPPAAYAAIYGGSGLLGGALLGVLVGSTRRWERAYPAARE